MLWRRRRKEIEKQRFVITRQDQSRKPLPAGSQMVDDGSRSRAAVDQVAEINDKAFPAVSLDIGGNDRLEGDQLVEATVDVAYGIDGVDTISPDNDPRIKRWPAAQETKHDQILHIGCSALALQGRPIRRAGGTAIWPQAQQVSNARPLLRTGGMARVCRRQFFAVVVTARLITTLQGDG
jgi:hypothetical protein